MASDAISYDRKELRAVISAFKAMDDEAVQQAKKESSALAEFAADKIKAAAATRQVSGVAARRIADGVRISKSSKVGEFSYGFASQRFSGGATTRDLWAGMEFGSNRFKQFPNRTPSMGKGNAGYFIYPTLRAIQPQLVKQWEEAFSKIIKEWD
jgi:hypothetical protein